LEILTGKLSSNDIAVVTVMDVEPSASIPLSTTSTVVELLISDTERPQRPFNHAVEAQRLFQLLTLDTDYPHIITIRDLDDEASSVASNIVPIDPQQGSRRRRKRCLLARLIQLPFNRPASAYTPVVLPFDLSAPENLEPNPLVLTAALENFIRPPPVARSQISLAPTTASESDLLERYLVRRVVTPYPGSIVEEPSRWTTFRRRLSLRHWRRSSALEIPQNGVAPNSAGPCVPQSKSVARPAISNSFNRSPVESQIPSHIDGITERPSIGQILPPSIEAVVTSRPDILRELSAPSSLPQRQVDRSLAARRARLRRIKSVEDLRSLIYEPGPFERYTNWDTLSMPNRWSSFSRTIYSRHGDQPLIEVADNRLLVQKDAEHRSSYSQHDPPEGNVWHEYLPESSRSAEARCSDPIFGRLTTSSRLSDRKPEDFEPEIPGPNANWKLGRCDNLKLRRWLSPQHPLRPNAKLQPNDTPKTKPARPSIIDATHAKENRMFQWKAKKHIRLILQELNIPLSSVTLRTSGTGETLEFDEEVAHQVKYGMIYDRWPKGDNNDPSVGFFHGMKKPCDSSSKEDKADKILQGLDSRLPFRRPNLPLITIRSDSDRENVDDPNNVKLQIPQAIIDNEDVSSRDDGRLLIKGDALKALLSNSIIWLPRCNPVLEDFNLLRSLPTSSSQLITDENGSVDILKTHLVHGRWTWLTKSVEKRNMDGKIDGRELGIDAYRTSEFDDARMMLLHDHPIDQPLKDFCNGKSVSYRDVPDNAGFKRMLYRLRPLVHESNAAAMNEMSRYLSGSEQNLKELWKVDYLVGENTRLAAAIQKAVRNRDILDQKIEAEIQGHDLDCPGEEDRTTVEDVPTTGAFCGATVVGEYHRY
jgi:hypothetical protein